MYKRKRNKIHIIISIIVFGIMITIIFSQKTLEGKMFFSQLTSVFALVSGAIDSKYNNEIFMFKFLIMMAIFMLIVVISSYLIYF